MITWLWIDWFNWIWTKFKTPGIEGIHHFLNFNDVNWIKRLDLINAIIDENNRLIPFRV